MAVTAVVQVKFNVPRRHHDILQNVASALGLDMSSLLRLIIAENLKQYVLRADKAAEGMQAAEELGNPKQKVANDPFERSERELDL